MNIKTTTAWIRFGFMFGHELQFFPFLFSLKLDEILLFHPVRQQEQQNTTTPELLCQMAALFHLI